MKEIEIISLPNHNYSYFFKPFVNLPKDWYHKEIFETTISIDDTKYLVEIHDILKVHFDKLTLVNFTIKGALGMDSKTFKKALVSKYGNRIEKAEIAIVLYKFLEQA